MNNKQKVEAKIRELVPELQELSFGCEVKLKGGSPFLELGPYLQVNNDFKARDVSGGYVDIAELDKWIDRKDAEIIGHPIHLGTLIEALKRCEKQPSHFSNALYDLYKGWDYSKSFSEQDDKYFELLSTLYGV